LESERIETLVFVPEGAWRSVPLSALHDGERHLIERYAVAMTPGLSLLGPKPLPTRSPNLLLAGLSAPVQGYPGLDYVLKEVEDLHRLVGGRLLLNENFNTREVEARFARESFSMVHFASHGEFAREARETFLLTYDGRLTLDELEWLIRPSQFRGQPVELLTLSACQTAHGDDRAALGLAGVALKAGARSALATLWAVHDEATALLVRRFYEELLRPERPSKAAALQSAQQFLLRDPRYDHPAFWSPYLIIGNWL